MPSKQILYQDVSKAVFAQALADSKAHRDNDGAELSALLDAAFLEDINHAFTVAAEAHASAVLGLERSVTRRQPRRVAFNRPHGAVSAGRWA